jgi:hypothetical protein
MTLRPPPYGSSAAKQEESASAPRLTSGVHPCLRASVRETIWRSEQQTLWTALRWNLDAMRRFLGEPPAVALQKLALDALQRAQRCEDLGQRLLEESTEKTPELRPLELTTLVKDALELLRWNLEERLLVREALPEEPVRVEGNEAKLQGAFLGMLLDAFRRAPAGEPWRHDLVLRGRIDGPMFMLEFQEIHGVQEHPAAPESAPAPAEEEDARGIWYHEVLRLHGGFLDLDATDLTRTTRLSLPRIPDTHETPASQRPTRPSPGLSATLLPPGTER